MCPTYKEVVVIEQTNKQCPVFTKYHRIGTISGEVPKIVRFLNKEFPDLKLNKNIIYTRSISKAVRRYQQKYYSDIIIPAGLSDVTGIWAQYSVKKANEIEGCSS